ncbi:conserved virulence factor C family protein [Paenibacillus senegalensis]|uniref:conserved virulence factor C family protein n=1 Tax=Paenibacillus senegalensis TaxID=1465766 RepID=UPI000287D018|nr:conserved virulence factor C family protein [Paenibacillus senegalensis]
MKVVSIEPTPSPNSMKLNMDEKLPDGVRKAYTLDSEDAPPAFKQLLSIPGVTGLYHAADFIAIDRHPRGDWQQILSQAREILGESEALARQSSSAAAEGNQGSQAAAFGEVQVKIQVFRGIPMQIRVSNDTEEQRAALPERFTRAATTAGLASPNLITERKLIEQGVRYGDLKEVLEEVKKELEAAYPQSRLDSMVEQAMNDWDEEAAQSESSVAVDELAEALNAEDWRVRYAALEQLKPSLEALPLLGKALKDPQVSIRRLAVVYMGDINEPDVLPYLFQALKDSSASVRRTAGDTLSDIGDPAAIGAMAEALSDRNKLVRWRAARFLFETGNETALPALKKAQDDPEFEVRMQIKLAIERIEGGEEALGSVWQQMTNRNRGQ